MSTAVLQSPRRIEPRFTPREQSVIALICDGLNNKEIAHRIGISVKVTKAYASDVYFKLGFNHTWGCPRVRLVLWAAEARRLHDAA